MKYDAFTLMELMIVMAIMSILAAIAIPTYRHYTERARFTGVIVAAEPYRTAVSLALQAGEAKDDLNTGDNGIPDAPQSDNNLASLTVDKGVIHAEASKAAGSYTYILTPNTDGSEWKTSGTCVKAGLCNS